jgi:O-acetylhomoserine/O-acetylserine sulfhydrylase-like pyridoxal-dependent enzyme
VRLAVGIENIADILADLEIGFAAAASDVALVGVATG